MRRGWIVVFALALLAAACAAEPAPSDTTPPATTAGTTVPAPTTTEGGTTVPGIVTTGDEVRLDLPRSSPQVDPGAIESVVAADTEFALDLFGAVAGEGNTLISPYSIAVALTMTYAGARGATRDEMAQVLGVELDDDVLHAARNLLDRAIVTEIVPGEDEPQPFVVRTANSLWGQRGYPFLEEFLAILATNYGAGLRIVDFAGATEAARVAINQWVAGQTSGRIEELIPQGVLDDLTTLVLVNAIWFKANWLIPFDAQQTASGTFLRLDGSSVTVPMMHGGGRLNYASGDTWAAASIPYVGDAAMLVIAPERGELEAVRTRLGEIIATFDSAASEHAVDLVMPKWAYRSSFSLKETLPEIGMPTAFVPPAGGTGADFTGMSAARELYIQDVIHEAFITVDERGTEAAAATAVVVGRTSAPPPAELTLDRPFLYLIRNSSTGEILFLGQVTDPTA